MHEIRFGNLSTFGVDLYKSQFDLTKSKPKCNATLYDSTDVSWYMSKQIYLVMTRVQPLLGVLTLDLQYKQKMAGKNIW